MQSQVALLALLAAVVKAAGAPQGFNYGALSPSGAAYQQSDFERLFKQAQNLPGASGFSSARLYTMIQGGSTGVTSAIPAAISTKTTLLLGMWVSAAANDDSAFKTELAGLKSAIAQYGDKLKDLVVGISVGSEDMYRDSPTGRTSSNPGPGQSGAAIASFIQQTKDYLKDTPLSKVPVGHVDTWTAWSDPNYAEGIKNADFLGVDAYPFWQLTDDNDITNGKSLFNAAMGKVQAAAGNKPLWITESGWPVKGKNQNKAVASTQNAQNFWQQVGCDSFGKIPTWWYTLEESVTGDNPDFSVVDPSNGKPYFDLSCSNVQINSTSSSTATATASGSASTGTGSSTGSGSSNGTYTSGSPSSPTTGSGSGSGSGTGSSGTGSGSGSGSSGSGSGSGTSTGSGSGSGTSSSASSVATAGAATMGVFSAGSLLAIAAAVAALL